MIKYEKKTNRDRENAYLVGSDAWFTVRAAQAIAKSTRRIIVLAVLAVLCLFAPAIGPISQAIQAWLN
ncbi:hypothetical protein [Vibrio diazotrophicus]|jgi:hypothetical protein|uniref:Uncharacterized protein n=1 Tax=Vibrio diazotrophicus TaxID=685 RepID=A0ABX4W4N8_VIBDI|nr:hypothetical protein [Vibrio diazotrophicus]EJB8414429.1 hypothetical protein [Vibrio vulnificus]PNH79315.1 hypothetical protein C1N27_14210 [Vibrio diazotrophicus]PNH89303.1 hypothetical protein C1M56_07610 [Vibrio diazotrophicus]PNH97280.1 hypothetical protein C1O25_20495 [Vibrio diazotrophicus]